MPRVEVEAKCPRCGLGDNTEPWTFTATATGRSALLLALGEAALAVHEADVDGYEFPSEEAATRWMKAREAYEAALAALGLREWDDHKGGTGGKPCVDGGGDDDK